MDRIAFLYPGQGSQRVGMGAELLASHAHLLEPRLTRAEQITGLPIRQYCFEGPVEMLTETQVAQPALFAVSLAVTDLARAAGLEPDFVAGHSLGEYTAAVAAGALDPEAGMELVCERGRLMSEIQKEKPGAMAAVMGLPAELVEDVCRRSADAGSVRVANLNAPTQTVVSGDEAGIERAMALAREAGAAKVVRLQVGAAFHSPFMTSAQALLRERMAAPVWNDPAPPLVANAWGTPLTTGEEVREALVAQITSPVRWVDCVRAMLAAGCRTFLELGPGRVLSGLVRQIDREAQTFAVESADKLDAFLSTRS